MMMVVVMGCNSGGVGGEGRSGLSDIISSARKEFLDAFLSFGELLKEVLGFNLDTTKKEVGEHLGKVGEAVNVVKGKLESLKSNGQFSLIKDKTDGIITKSIDTLKKIVDGVSKIKGATGGANDKIASATGDNNDAVPADTASVKGLVEGISMIYEAAKEVKVDLKGNADKTIADSKAIAKLFNGSANVSDATGLKAANVALNAASGADVLAAIEAVKEQSSAAGNIDAAKNAYDIAIANKSNDDITGNVKTNASAITAGLALRGMAKDGKLATKATDAPKEGINAVLSRAVSKTVNEIMFNIRRTVDKCLKDVNDCIEENFNSEIKSK
ncbi:Variable major outer membrane lipoprotein [Borrelia duttonii CR2A]|uniref:Variable large protein n=1 Tax=Borrelia duttonii CR2A TaxID=1432657 RepID=W6TG95_9SPIR|nr:variable large family protein [Borrelia duttonii]ETZ17363.1 Variable major outer membrane lipoprotein [Borrelia duttonii CR2A]